MFLVVICAIEIPMRLSLGYEMKGWLLFGDWLITASFAIDLILNFITTVEEQGLKLTKKRHIAKHYLKGWFTIDFLSTVPFDFLLEGMFPISPRTLRILRLARLMRLLRLAKLSQVTSSWGSGSAFINQSVFRLSLMLFWVLLLAHWIACVWVVLDGVQLTDDLFAGYTQALYWSVTTLTTVGYGDITPKTNGQMFYTMTIMFLGVGVYGYVIGNVAALLSNMDVAKARFTEKIEELNAFFTYRKIPQDVQLRVRNYYNYLWNNDLVHDESELLAEMPRSLASEIAIFLNTNILKKVPLFTKAPADLIEKLALSLKPLVYLPGDYIIRRGEIGSEMFFIARGEVEILIGDDETVLDTISEGGFFGEMALILNQPRSASVRTNDFCDLYLLSADDMNRILQSYPEFRKEIEEMARERLAEDNKSQFEQQSIALPAGEVLDLVVKPDAKGNVLQWRNMPEAIVYQVIRKGAGGEWQKINECVQFNHFIDDTGDADSVYRVRGINQAGKSEWSNSIAVRPGR